MRLVVRRLAKLDLAEASRWYAARQPGLGDRLRAAVDEVLASICSQPLIHRRVDARTRRASVPGFPYGVFFVVTGEVVRVLAILHNARSPERWKGRS